MNHTNFDYIYLTEVDSTNTAAKKMWNDGKIISNTIISTGYQTQGKGQQNSVWESQAQSNLLFTIVLLPKALLVHEQVYLNMAVSLAIYDYLASKNISHCSIKWPNDIYIDDKKIAGILIENSITQNVIKNTFIGIGININQTKFNNPFATSLALVCDTNYVLEHELKKVELCFVKRYSQIQKQKQLLFYDYSACLYLKNIRTKFGFDNKEEYGKIIDVNVFGQLVINFESGENRSFSNKEVKIIV